MMHRLLLALLIGSVTGLQLHAAPRPAAAATRPTMVGFGRTAHVCMQEGQDTWNTAKDANGETYYWRGKESTYEKPADFDPSLAKDSGMYKGTADDGALYDDEISDAQVTYTDGTKKPEISNAMRDRLINESRGLGADPNQKNPFLFVFAGVGVFVLLGAVAINM